MIKIMLRSKSSNMIAAVIMACLLITTMLIVPTVSQNYNPNAETTFHTVMVDVINGKVVMSIEPLVSKSRCDSDGGCPVENRTCCSGEAYSLERVVLERGENYAVTLFSIENGENRFEATVTRTRLWNYIKTQKKANVTISLTETSTVVSEDLTASSRELAYIIQYQEYTVRGVSLLSPSQDSTAYQTCFSIMNYIPANKTEIRSLEMVQFNATVTLSQHYAILSEVAKEMRKIYKHSQNQTFNELVNAYHAMEKEAKQISKLIEKQLLNYNHEILQSIAILRDPIECDSACYMAESIMSLEYEPQDQPPTRNGGGGGGGSPPPPSGCNWECVINCVLQEPELTANCIYALYVCAIAPGPQNPACWLLIVCVLTYGIVCALMCCWW